MSELQESVACPFCGEQINSKAIKCKHCQSMLNENPSTFAPQIAGVNVQGHELAAGPQVWDKGKALEEFVRDYYQDYRHNHPIPVKTKGGGLMGYLKNYFANDPPEIYFEEEISAEVLKAHAHYTAEINCQVERPLLAINAPDRLLSPSGVVLTRQALYYCVVPAKMLSLGLGGLSPTSGKMAIADIKSIVIGGWGSALDCSYQGHELYINGHNIGWVRMGAGVGGDDKVEQCVKDIFSKMTVQLFQQ